MSKRTDFLEQALELFDLFQKNQYAGPSMQHKIVARVRTELHNAFVAGQEQARAASGAIVLSEEGYSRMLDAIENPREPTKALVELMQLKDPNERPPRGPIREREGIYKNCPHPAHVLSCTCAKDAEQ